MFKAARWKSDKNKVKAVFKFEFQATQVHHQEWEELMVSLFPVDTGKLTARSEKIKIVDGSCNWAVPIYETVGLIQDSKTGKFNEKSYQFVLSATGSVKSGALGEIDINLADYAEAFKPYSVSLPLKAPNAAAVLHVTVQRVPGEAERRALDEEGNKIMKQQRRTLRSQLGNSVLERKVLTKTDNGIKPTEEVSYLGNQAKHNFLSNRIMTVQVKSNEILRKSYSLDAISASGSDSSSERYTPLENGAKNNINHQGYGSLLSPLSSTDTPRDSIIALGNDWSIISAPYGSIDGSSSSSGEALLRDASHESDNISEKLNNDAIVLTRQLEVSKLELQTLRKQVVKESRRGNDLARELQIMKEERDELERECVELKALIKRAADNEHVSTKLQFEGSDKWSLLKETKQELNHEKILNANLLLQLKKANESNAELILVVRDLELLKKKNNESSFGGCSCASIKPDIMKDMEEMKFKTRLPQLHNFECHQNSLGTSTYEEDELYALNALVNLPSDINVLNLPDHKIAHLTTELELYKKEREELEMQMEQLALDYEILKQENHDISKKLEQIQVREQLRLQFDCSAQFASISELEVQIECLENEIERLTEEFQADLKIISGDKVEQEKKAIQAEEALRKTKLYNYNTAKQLQEEFKTLTTQMSSAFYMNEKLVMQTLKESSELQMQKCHLEEMLEKTNKELGLVRHEHHVKVQRLLSLVDFKTKEVDSLVLELKEKCKEIENLSMTAEARQQASSEQIEQLTAEVEKLSRRNNHFAEQIKLKEKLIEEMNQLKVSITERNMLLQAYEKEIYMLEEEISLLKVEAKKSIQELNDLRQQKVENDATIINLNAEIMMHRAPNNDLKHFQFVDELEQENLRKEVGLLSDDLQNEAGFIAIIGKKSKDLNAKLINPEGLIMSSTRSKISLHEKTLLPENCRSNGDHTQNHIIEDKKKIKDLNSIGKALIISNTVNSPEIQEERSILCTCEHQKTKALLEMSELKEQNQMKEAELKEMQERYSEMSLKFAEVEGERHQLVIKIRSLKNSIKIV